MWPAFLLLLAFPVRPVWDKHHVPKCLWSLPKERITVITSEVPIKSLEKKTSNELSSMQVDNGIERNQD